MKLNRKENKGFVLSFRSRLLLVIVAAFTLVATSIIQYIYTQRSIKQEASLRAEDPTSP